MYLLLNRKTYQFALLLFCTILFVQPLSAQKEVFILPVMNGYDTFKTMESAARKWFDLNRKSESGDEDQIKYISCKRFSSMTVVVVHQRTWVNRAGSGGADKPEKVTDSPYEESTNIVIAEIEDEVKADEKPTAAPGIVDGSQKKETEQAGNGLNAEGKFIEKQLETDYTDYVVRKKAKGGNIKNRVEWKAAKDYWLKDSPMARGNAFNSKAQQSQWYDFFEVNLENGKRLDSYVPPGNGTAGEIISRKATNFIEIKLATFESYLKEMKTKYAVGLKIRSNKYPALDGQTLQGKQILEIPDSNQSFKDIKAYTDLAKNKYNIELRFRPE